MLWSYENTFVVKENKNNNFIQQFILFFHWVTVHCGISNYEKDTNKAIFLLTNFTEYMVP